ncbi:glutamic acid-rich protein-like [Danio aesculapii]|uniref:glutamic acid-rich protein-like n=1 Tax=Danio aesculapii TaxID=1142201 RepID=UPI0024C02230|nr:glutamic acid-rich protein-like [Danio aesculapii]
MEFVVRVLLFFTCLCFHDFVFCEEYAEMGGLITFSPSIRGKPVEILWKHNGDKVVEYDNSEMEEYGSFKDRVELDFETGQLTIKKLTSQDGGQYQSDITINGKVQSSRHTLTVLDVLPDPRVTCEVNEASNLQELLCSVDYKTPLLYKWSGPNMIDHPGVKLIIDEQQKNSDSIYTCTVKNEVSSKTIDFNLQDCITGGVKLEVILPVLTVIILILIIILAIFIYKKMQSRRTGEKKTNLEYGSSEEKEPLNHSGNKEERCKNAVLAEENACSKPDETEQEKLLGGQDEEEIDLGIGKNGLLKIDEGVNDVKIPSELKEKGNVKEKDQQNTGSSGAIFPNGSDKTGENGGKAKALKDSGNEEEQCSNENSRHAVVEEENANRKAEETQKLQESQDEEEEGQTEKLDKGNEMGEMSVKELTEKLGGLNINNSDYKDKISEEKKQEGNKEQKDQQSTATQGTSTAQSYQYGQQEESQKPQKRNESGETSAQQQNEGEVTARNEDQQTTGANTQEEDHKSLSCELKQEDMKQSNDPADAGINKHLNDNEVKIPDLDQRKDDLSVPEDEQHETQSDNLQKQEHLSKQNSTERESQLQRENIGEESDTDSDL